MLIVHVGRHKTGTSSIQHFLHDNREELKKHGVIYPEPIGSVTAHHGIALALAANQDIAEHRSLLRAVRPQERTVVLSSEGFQRLKIRQAKVLTDDHRGYTQAAIYLREQFSNAVAAYSQIVLANLHAASFERTLKDYRPRYHGCLARWSCATEGKVIVRIFDRNKLIDGDVVADFCGAVLSIDAAQLPKAKVVNETLGWRVLNFSRAVNSRIADHPNAAIIKRELFHGLRAIATAYPELKEKPLFDAGVIELYQAQFADENRQIAKEYFGMSDTPLFDLSWHGDSVWDTCESLIPRHIEALYDRCPALKQFHEVIGSAAEA